MTILRDFAPPFLSESLVRERFIETGLYSGETMIQASQQNFERLDGIEIHPDWVRYCRGQFALEPRVCVHHGSSPEVLREILQDVPTTFWLDAHFTGDSTRRDLMSPRHGECPLLAELTVIVAFPWTTRPLIVIDDVQMFQEEFWKSAVARNFNKAHWPRLRQVEQALDRYQLSIHDNVLYAVGT